MFQPLWRGWNISAPFGRRHETTYSLVSTGRNVYHPDRMPGYFVRIQSIDGYEECIRQLVNDESYKRILCVSHKGDKKDANPHYHLTIDTECKEKAFRKRMIKIFDKAKGNGHMSIKEWDGSDDANAYMFHEDNENANVIVNKGYSQESISKFIERNSIVKTIVEEAKEKAAYKSEEIVLERVKSKMKMEDGWWPDDVWIGCEIYRVAYERKKYPPDDWLLRAMVKNIKMSVLNDEDREYYVKDLVLRALRLNSN